MVIDFQKILQSKQRVFKADLIEWVNKVDIVFNDLEKIKNKKINLKNIFKITIDNEIKTKWTKNQKEWINQNINLKTLFSNNLKTISRIDDFRRKYLMSYWGKLMENCKLCDEKFSRKHLFQECSVVNIWEKNVYGNNNNISKIKTRIESMFDNKSQNHTSSWIYNWCIWKNYWEIVYSKFESCELIDKQISNLKKLIKFNEYLHLRFSIESSIKIETIENETKIFNFYQLKKDHLKNNGEKGNKRIFLKKKKRKKQLIKKKNHLFQKKSHNLFSSCSFS